MTQPQETCWTLIRDARDGKPDARTRFTGRYFDSVRAYFVARWKSTPLSSEVDDAVQEVFLDCFRHGGALERAEPEHGSGFRAFFFGVTRTVALRVESRRAREWEKRGGELFQPERIAAREETLSRLFDRAWARAVVKEAADLQAEKARARGAESSKLVELLRLRFHDGKPIREIAKLWGVDPARLHHDYARARKDFLDALREVIATHEKCAHHTLDEECNRLLELLRKR
jgi:RNA polymerase sigma factor (sigma-70 family)